MYGLGIRISGSAWRKRWRNIIAAQFAA